MQRVRDVMALSAKPTSIINVVGSTSTNTGIQPAMHIAEIVGGQVLETVITSSPG
jgi:hypothetical protein